MASLRIDRLLQSKESFDPDLIDVLDSNDLADALNRALDAGNPNRVRAIAILAPFDPNGAAQAVGQIMQEGGDPVQLAAAISAAIAAGPLLTPLAMSVGAASDTAVALAAWLAIQRTASSADLPALASLAQQTSGVVAEQAAFAQSVVAYRAGFSGFELSVPDSSAILEADVNLETVIVASARANEADFARLSRLSNAELYKVALTRAGTTAIDCGGAHMLLALDSDIQDAIPDTLVQVPALTGIIALLDPLGLTYSVRHLVLTWPNDKGGFNIALHQPGGVQVYFGTGEAAQGLANLSVRSVVQPGAVPVDITISATPAGVEFRQAIALAEVSKSAPKLELQPDPDE